MIKLTYRHSESPNAPALFLIPGGPGLSSATLRSLDRLSRSFHLYYVDLPGTNGVPYERDRSFAEIAAEIAAEVSKVGGRSFLFGHSFGGFWAADVALKVPMVAGVICAADRKSVV